MTTDTQEHLSDVAPGEVVLSDSGLQVVFRRRYAKSIEKVWGAITTPERLADWLAVAEVDLKPGGVIRLNWNGRYSMEGRVTACEPPRIFAWSWPIDDRETNVRFELQSDGDGCRLTLTHSGLSSRPGSEGGSVRAGWHAHLEGLPDALESRRTPWETKAAREAALSPLYPPLLAGAREEQA